MLSVSTFHISVAAAISNIRLWIFCTQLQDFKEDSFPLDSLEDIGMKA